MKKAPYLLLCNNMFTKYFDTIILAHQVPVVQNLIKLLAKVMLNFLSWNMANTLFFVEKNVSSFCIIWKYLSNNS